MGNQHGKGKEQSLFTADELKILEASFRNCGAHGEKLAKEKLLEAWSLIIDEHLAECTLNFLYKAGPHPTTTITMKRFGEPYYMVENGTIEDKVNFLAASLNKTDTHQYALKEFELYIASVVKSFIKMEAEQGNAAYESWKTHGYQSAERTILAFAKGLIRNIKSENEHFINMGELERWLQVNPTFLIIWRETFQYLYSKNSGKSYKLGNPTATNILPSMEGLALGTNYIPILDIPHIIFVNNNLPTQFRHKWRFLFSSKIMGESFSTMLGKILNRGPTLILVEDEDRFVFAGYAPESWALKPNFVGDDTSMLLTLSPAMRCFNATGYNNHYQYLNLNQQTMPNGLGMGGQFGYWGFWLDCDYGLGQSCESCTTYQDYVQLSKRKEFRIRNIEVWGIGDEPKLGDDSDEEGEAKPNKRSVLDKNLEDRVMLELAGKSMHSDGYREPDPDMDL